MRKTVVVFAIVVLVLGALALVVTAPLTEVVAVIAAPVSLPELVETQPPLLALSSSGHLPRASLPVHGRRSTRCCRELTHSL